MKETWSQYLGTRYWCLQVDSPEVNTCLNPCLSLTLQYPSTIALLSPHDTSLLPILPEAECLLKWAVASVNAWAWYHLCLLDGALPPMFVTGSVSSEPALAYYHIALLLNDLRLALWSHMTWEIFTMLLIMAFSGTCWVCKTGHVCCSPPFPQPRKYSKERCSVAFLIIQSPDLWIWKVQTDIILGWQNLVMRCWLTNRALREWRRIWKPINLIGRKV